MKAQPWLLLPLIGLLGCNGDSCGGGGSGPLFDALVESGVYAAENPYPEVDFFDVTIPHTGGRDFTVDVDRAAGLVTVRYERDGQIVEEIWRITSQEVSVH